jgi:hypothetical protein
MTWHIECYRNNVVIERNDTRRTERRNVHWWDNPPACKWISLDSMDRLCRVASGYATAITLERDGWEADGEDEALR